ncbi:hypothetical protein [Hahella sp. NBU794]|uniref:hypothetical protein n=1 Tax=Hahella sp. NBU794 TaxID=3422590 RepID=UPI003D6F7677
MVMNSATNEMEFYGDRGNGQIDKLATIGITQSGGDYYIGSFGNAQEGNNRIALRATSNTGVAIQGVSNRTSISGTTFGPNPYYGIGGNATGTGKGAQGTSAGGIGVYGAGANYGPLTAGHDCLIRKQENVRPGQILVYDRLVHRKNLSNVIHSPAIQGNVAKPASFCGRSLLTNRSFRRRLTCRTSRSLRFTRCRKSTTWAV